MDAGAHGWSRPEEDLGPLGFICDYHVATTRRLDNHRTAQIISQCRWCRSCTNEEPHPWERSIEAPHS